MPLIKSPSKKAFQKNVETEMNANPGSSHRAQNLAIAYSTMRKARAKAHAGGGKIEQQEPMTRKHDAPEMSRRERAIRAAMGEQIPDPVQDERLESHAHETDMVQGHESNEEHERDRHDEMGEPMAEGGQIRDNYQDSGHEHLTDLDVIDPQEGYDPMHPGDDIKHDEAATEEDERMLNQHGVDEIGPEDHMAEGGQISDNYADEEDGDGQDMIDAIMHMREHAYSKGGRVANENSGESASIPDHMAKDSPNEFDDLALRDDLESTYGEDNNSGDESGNAQEDSDRNDMVSKIMSYRQLKSRKLPNAIKPGLK